MAIRTRARSISWTARQHFLGHDPVCAPSWTNEDQVLFPGLFARVRIPLGEPKPALVVPNRAIGNDQEGDYVLVVDAGDIVARRTVVKGPCWMTGCAIRSGLAPTDRVIVNGFMRAKPGAKVTPDGTETSATPAR